MAEVPAAVTDTHPLLFHAAGAGRLGRKAAAHFAACEAREAREALVFVPAVVGLPRIARDGGIRGAGVVKVLW